MDCIFCKIINGEIPSYKLYEDDEFIVIMDISPHANGHLLVITKNHYSNLFDLDDTINNKLNDIVKRNYNMLNEKLNVEGAYIGNNVGNAQEIKHFHMHIIPAEKNINKEKIKDNVKNIYEKLIS